MNDALWNRSNVTRRIHDGGVVTIRTHNPIRTLPRVKIKGVCTACRGLLSLFLTDSRLTKHSTAPLYVKQTDTTFFLTYPSPTLQRPWSTDIMLQFK